MFVSSHPEWCDRYRGSDKTEEGSQMLSLYRFLVHVGTRPLIKDGWVYKYASCTPGVSTGTRALIKHGEITALEDSKAAPEKVRYQPFAKNQN